LIILPQNILWVNTAVIGTYFNFDMHGCRTDFQENIEIQPIPMISRSLIAFGRQ
jgi:hypothetical protein